MLVKTIQYIKLLVKICTLIKLHIKMCWLGQICTKTLINFHED